jgi:hypothetical protein
MFCCYLFACQNSDDKRKYWLSSYLFGNIHELVLYKHYVLTLFCIQRKFVIIAPISLYTILTFMMFYISVSQSRNWIEITQQ